MSAAKEGMRLQKEAQVLTERMSDGVYTGVANNQGVQGGAQAVQFQRKFLARDNMDDEMNTKMQLMDKDGMTPFGQVYYDERVGKWLERKEAAAEAANFDSYFNANFNVNDLAGRQWAQQIHPDFYRAREAEMNERIEIVRRLKGIQLRGPQDKQDLYMLWLIDSGRVQLPADWDRIGAGFSGTAETPELKQQNATNFSRGLIRMPLFLSNPQQVARATQNRDVGAWGNPTRSAPNTFAVGNPPSVGNNNNPLSSLSGGKTTIANNFVKFLRQGGQ